jgi:putative ABC transport system substrate-binding protein
LILASVQLAEAQQGKVWRIGFLEPSSAAGTASRIEALRAGLRELGYLEGKNLTIDFRWAEGRYERLPGLAAELVDLKPDVIATHGGAGILTAKNATATIPIVMCMVGDAVVTGLVASLARPGGNVTGSTFFGLELQGKRIELLKEIFPRAKRFAFLMNPDDPMSAPGYAAAEGAAKLLKVELQQFAMRGPAEFENAFSAMVKARVDAMVVAEDRVFATHAKTIAELAAKHRLPMASGTLYAEAGSLVGYGPNMLEMFRRAAYFMDRIFKGAKPADLPVERSTRFELVINLKTAKQLGLTIPQSVLYRADRVIK